MPRLRAAERHEIEAILRESHAIWGAGLALADYVEKWLDLMDTTWARQNFAFLVWVEDDGSVLSSMKLYRPLLRDRTSSSRAAGIGAVFTPPARRRQGHATAMLRALMELAHATGTRAAVLFSDIGVEYYERLGFRTLPAEEAWGRLSRQGPTSPTGYTLRPMRASDLDAVRAAHDEWCERRPFAILRDREYWEFLMARAAAFFARLDGSNLSRRYRVALHDGEFAGYLIAVQGQGIWTVREVGAANADPDTIAAILRTGAAEAWEDGMRRVFGWFPRPLGDLLPEWRLRFEPRRRAVPMIRALDGAIDLGPLDTPAAAYLPYLDQF